MRFAPFLHRHGSMPTTLDRRQNDMRSAFEHRTVTALSEKLRATNDVTSELIAEIFDVTCRRSPILRNSAKVLRLKELLDASAWTDAALALIELELPLWHIRRITYDAGEWHCALSRQC